MVACVENVLKVHKQTTQSNKFEAILTKYKSFRFAEIAKLPLHYCCIAESTISGNDDVAELQDQCVPAQTPPPTTPLQDSLLVMECHHSCTYQHQHFECAVGAGRI